MPRGGYGPGRGGFGPGPRGWRGGFGPGPRGPWGRPWRGGFGPGPGFYGPGFRRRWWGPRYYPGSGCCCLFTLLSFAFLGVLTVGGLAGISRIKKSSTANPQDK